MRNSGKTTWQIELCKRIGGVVICGTEEKAEQIRKEHGVKAMCNMPQDPPGEIWEFWDEATKFDGDNE